MNRSFLFFILFLSSCSAVQIEGGFASPELGGQSFIKDTENLHHLHGGMGAVHAIKEFDIGPVGVDIGLGPMFWGSHQGTVYGGEGMARIRFKVSDFFQPYIVGTAGMGFASGWEGSDVDYSYTSGLGFGGLLKVKEGVSLTADWRWSHHSNGMTFLSDSWRDFIGQTKATRNDGYQNGAVFVGIQVDF